MAAAAAEQEQLGKKAVARQLYAKVRIFEHFERMTDDILLMGAEMRLIILSSRHVLSL